MLPPEGVLTAAGRWIELLQLGTSVEHAWGLIRNAPGFADLSVTQYATALNWISDLGLLPELLRPTAQRGAELAGRTFAIAITALSPAWLVDADTFFDDPTDLPLDAIRLAELFGVSDKRILPLIHGIGRKVDPEQQARIGLSGETELAALIESALPGSVRHVSLSDDTLGYDIVVMADTESHLEIKSTTRRGRLIVYLSRHEFEIGSTDSAWALVVVGLDANHRLAAFATVRPGVLRDRAPRDVSRLGRWDSVTIELKPEDLSRGLSVADLSLSLLKAPPGSQGTGFTWMP